MNNPSLPLPRAFTANVREALSTFPVVVLTGARQTGKSTLIRHLLGPPGRRYYSLDDLDVLERAQTAPDALLHGKQPVTLDEIQRSPDLLLAIKRAVDDRRRPGRFLLSGSANLLLMRRVSESLAGRAVYLELHPFTLGERQGGGAAGAWTALLEDPSRLEGEHQPLPHLDDILLTGGFPPAVLAPTIVARQQWFDGYVRTYLERDLQSLSNIQNLIEFRRLMRVAALRSGALVNQSDMARDAGIPQPSAHRYLDLLEASYLVRRLPAYCVNRTKRVIKSPRLFFCDSGLAASLAAVRTGAELARMNLRGALLENLVLSELLAWREQLLPRPEILYWRTSSGEEVDFVVETAGRLLPIEVKSGPSIRRADLGSLRSFLAEYRAEAPHGIVLHTGRRAEQLEDRIWSVPISAALNAPAAPRQARAAARRGAG